jgi:hypothetical protein
MTLGFEALSVFLILLPGFLCAKIVGSLCIGSQRSEMDKVVDALLYSFLIYVVFVSIFGPQITGRTILWLPAMSLILATSVSAMWTHDFPARLLRRWKLTMKTSRPSVWTDAFSMFGGAVLVELADGRMVVGWVRYYSDPPSAPSLFLEHAAWIDREEKQAKINGPGILITPECGIRTVSFHAAKDLRYSVPAKPEAMTTAGP